MKQASETFIEEAIPLVLFNDEKKGKLNNNN